MDIGLCLVGGGAKGAFQGGVIKKLYEKNIYPNIITGTSIGAVNGYFLFKNAYVELEKLWLNIENNSLEFKPGRVINNDLLIEKLKMLKGKNEYIRNFYINYVQVQGNELKEIEVDIANLDVDKAIEAVKFSSLLPARINSSGEWGKIIKEFDSKKLFDDFIEDLNVGLYEGFSLDGGILNNNYMQPFIKNNVDKIIVVGLKDTFVVPEYIYDYYSPSDICVIKPDFKIEPRDTVRFEGEFCSKMFKRGYILAENII